YGTDILIEPEVITGDLEAKVDSVLSAEIERFYSIAAKHLERRLKKYESFINLAHEAYPNVPIDLIKAIAYAESNGNSKARSPKGARGLMQLMPGTANDMGVPPEKREDPYHSIMGGTRYLSDLMEKYEDNEVLVSIAYNRGPARIDRYLERKNLLPSQVRWSSLVNLVNQETRDYVARVRAGRYAISETS
ncbi:lytic transglycosylase domain-containing protein, partial [Candidatus Woesearchaeota archaeon]|nr:lytic transglycosylase domain-containing protein [Candidatus Woesearchaeota archaeon]